MKKTLLSTLATLSLLPFAAHAVPVQYEMTFSANSDDADGGTGSFFWDDTTHSLSALTWDFGGTSVGSVNDAVAPWSATAFGGTVAEFAFEIFTLQETSPADCLSNLVSCGVGFSASTGLVGYPGLQIQFQESGVGDQTYTLWLKNERELTGTFSTRKIGGEPPVTGVPEPTSLSLLALGLVGFGLVARQRAQTKKASILRP